MTPKIKMKIMKKNTRTNIRVPGTQGNKIQSLYITDFMKFFQQKKQRNPQKALTDNHVGFLNF